MKRGDAMSSYIEQYAAKIHELIEVPRNELRQKVYGKKQLEYCDLLERYEELYVEKCKKISELLEEEYQEKNFLKCSKNS